MEYAFFRSSPFGSVGFLCIGRSEASLTLQKALWGGWNPAADWQSAFARGFLARETFPRGPSVACLDAQASAQTHSPPDPRSGPAGTHALRTERKYFHHTIKMIVYCAETSMAFTVREKLKRSDDARALLRQIYNRH